MYTVKDLHKSYGGVKALDGVDFEIHQGEVHALLGANGAGKSTLIKVLVGGTQPRRGGARARRRAGRLRQLPRGGRPRRRDRLAGADPLPASGRAPEPLPRPRAARRRRRPRPPRDAAAGAAGARGDRPRRRPQPRRRHLRLGEQQLVEVARALLNEPKILVLDEPTSALQQAETERLLEVVRDLRDRGVAVVYVSHFLEDVFAVADRITVLRSGQVVVARRPREEMTIQDTVVEMLGEAGAREKHITDATAFEEAAGRRGAAGARRRRRRKASSSPST